MQIYKTNSHALYLKDRYILANSFEEAVAITTKYIKDFQSKHGTTNYYASDLKSIEFVSGDVIGDPQQ